MDINDVIIQYMYIFYRISHKHFGVRILNQNDRLKENQYIMDPAPKKLHGYFIHWLIFADKSISQICLLPFKYDTEII